MGMLLGAAILLVAMIYALFVLFIGMRNGTIRYFGRTIARADNPAVFWFTMAVMVGCLFLAARTLPLYLVAIL